MLRRLDEQPHSTVLGHPDLDRHTDEIRGRARLQRPRRRHAFRRYDGRNADHPSDALTSIVQRQSQAAS